MLRKVMRRVLSLVLTATVVLSLGFIVPMNAEASTYVWMKKTPTKSTYQVGEGYDTTGINVVYCDNDVETDITNQVTLFHKKVPVVQGTTFDTPGTKVIEAYYEGRLIGGYSITIVEATKSNTDSSGASTGWPFVPSNQNMTNGKIKSGWAYVSSHEDAKFRVNSDNTVSLSFRFNNAFYFEHLGKDIYYIHAAYGGYLAYKGKVTDQSAPIIISDTPCKWFLDAYNDGGVRRFALVAEENHKYVIRTWGYCNEKTDSKITLHNTMNGTASMDDCRFIVSDWVDSHMIPQWWNDYKAGKPAPAGKIEEPEEKEGYNYYGELGFTKETELPVTTTCINYNIERPEFNKEFPDYSVTAKSYLLCRNERGTYLRASTDGEYVTITKHSTTGTEIGSKEIKYPLPIFGGIFCGKEYNYIVFGQNNKEENDSKESIRIIKYDKEFNKIASVSVGGGQTKAIKPLNFSSRFAENGTQLILHTARTRYKSNDGINHQSNLDIFVDTDQMKVTYVSPLFPENHVSHSFDTFVRFDGKTPVYLDLGDAYPRSVVLQKASGSSYTKGTMFAIAGPTGANYTGVTVGGFEVSKSNYLTAIATIDQAAAKWKKNVKSVASQIPTNINSLTQHDIVVCALPRNFRNGETAKTITIGQYIGTTKLASTPQMLKISDNKFAVLWAEYSLNNPKSSDSGEEIPDYYLVQYIDENGNKSGDPIQYKNVNDFYTEYLNQYGN